MAPHKPSESFVASSSRTNWLLVAVGFYLLIQSAFYDNIRGPLLPILAAEYEINYDQVSRFVFFGNIFGLLTILTLGRALRTVSERTLTAICLTCACVLAMFTPFIDSYADLLILALGIGLTTASFGTLCNLLVFHGIAVEHSSRALSGLHAMYGIGSFMAAAAGSIFPLKDGAWSYLFLATLPFLCTALILVAVRPSFKRLALAEREQPTSLDLYQFTVIALYGAYVAAEVIFSMWFVTYLKEARGFAVADASSFLTWFFVILTIARISASFWVTTRNEVVVLGGCLLMAALAFVLGMISTPAFFIGMGLLGPFFPVMLARVRRASPRAWRSMTVRVIVSSQLALIIGHYAMGRISELFGVGDAFYLVFAALLATIIAFAMTLRVEPPSSQV